MLLASKDARELCFSSGDRYSKRRFELDMRLLARSLTLVYVCVCVWGGGGVDSLAVGGLVFVWWSDACMRACMSRAIALCPEEHANRR